MQLKLARNPWLRTSALETLHPRQATVLIMAQIGLPYTVGLPISGLKLLHMTCQRLEITQGNSRLHSAHLNFMACQIIFKSTTMAFSTSSINFSLPLPKTRCG